MSQDTKYKVQRFVYKNIMNIKQDPKVPKASISELLNERHGRPQWACGGTKFSKNKIK